MDSVRARVMTVYGTRPEAIKLAPVITALNSDDRFDSIVVSTGQHQDMLANVEKRFGIRPDYELGLMVHGQALNLLVARVLVGLDQLIADVGPDILIVQGDTSTAMAAGLACFHRGIKVVHLEAGLRTGDIASPFPEEGNRRIITQVAHLHLSPTQGAKANLLREAVPARDVVVTGNTVIDSLFQALDWHVDFDDERLNQLMALDRRVVLITTHRRENLASLRQIGVAIQTLASRFPECSFVLPLHPNPRVRDVLQPMFIGVANVIVSSPLPYDQFTQLLNRADLILTDSGGIQEEAPSLGKPVLVMRDNTERPDALVAGTVKLVGTGTDNIVLQASRLLEDNVAYAKMASAVNPYGDGKAAGRVIAALAELAGFGDRLPDFKIEI